MIATLLLSTALAAASATAPAATKPASPSPQAAAAAPATAPAATSPQAARASTAADTARPAGLAVTFSAVLEVDEPGKAADQLVARAEAMGGWFAQRTQEYLSLRLPARHVDALLDSLPALGLVVEKSMETESLEGQQADLEARLKAKRATLDDYYAMLKVSGDSTIFTLQNAIASLQMDIEQTMQQKLKLEDRMAFARVTVSFRFQDRRAPLANGRSRFPWLNELGLQNLMGRFDYVWK